MVLIVERWFLVLHVLLMCTITCCSDIAEVCPYSTFCTEVPRIKDDVKKWESCCVPCSCSDKCDLVGNCCDDIGRDVSPPRYPCLHQNEIYGTYLNTSTESNLLVEFRVVTGCHGDINTVSKESVSRCYTARDIDDLAFVTSTTTTITYLNKHCALCNNDSNYVTWDLYTFSINVESILTVSSYKTRDEYLIKTGSFVSMPNSNIMRSAICSNDEYNTCNRTGIWKNYDKEIKENCERYNMYFITKTVFYHYNVFKNPFCYSCNMAYSVLNCEDMFNLDDIRDMGTTFSAMIVTARQPDFSTLEMTKSCRYGETMDLFRNECTPIHCPIGSIAAQDTGTCESFLTRDRGLVMEVSYFVPLNSKNTSSENSLYFNLMIDLGEFYIQQISGNVTECNLCKTYLSTAPNDTLLVALAIISSRECPYEFIMSRMRTVPESFHVYSRSADMDVVMTVVKSYDQTDATPRILAEVKSARKACRTDIYYSESIVLCPSLVTTTTDIENLPIDAAIKTEIISHAVSLDRNGTIRVCLDHYNMMFRMYVASTGYTHVKTTWPNIIVILYLTIPVP